jgi:hypothetical protein
MASISGLVFLADQRTLRPAAMSRLSRIAETVPILRTPHLAGPSGRRAHFRQARPHGAVKRLSPEPSCGGGLASTAMPRSRLAGPTSAAALQTFLRGYRSARLICDGTA